MTGCSKARNAGSDSCRNGMVGTGKPISPAVITACTPGHASAALLSIARMRPCASGLRTITACSMFSNARSSTYCPRPLRNRKSSIRSIGLPIRALVARFRSISDDHSDDNGYFFIEQRPRDAQGRQCRGLGVAARWSPLKLDGEFSGGAFDLDLMYVAGRFGIGDEL